MELQRFAADDRRLVRTIDEDSQVVIADLGQGIDGSIELVDDTAIIVLTNDETVEIDLPATPESAFITNGVLTIELEDEQ